MPINLIRQNAGIVLLLIGAAFENLFGPTLLGWGLLLFGALFHWVWPQQLRVRVPFTVAFGILVAFGLLSLLVTADLTVSRGPVNQLVVNTILTFGLVGWLYHSGRVVLYTAFLVAFGVALAMAAPLTIEWQQNKGGLIPDAFYARLPVVLSDPVHPNIMASLMLLFFPMPLLLFFRSGRAGWTTRTVVTAAAAAVMLLVLFLTRSRAGYLIGAIGVVWTLWLTQWRRVALVVAALGAVLALFLLLGSQQGTAAADLSDASTLAFRFNVWRLALDMLRDFPFTGVGMSQFNPVAERLYPYPSTDSLGAHNLYLQVAVDLGLVALMGFLFIFWGTLWRGWQLYSRRGGQSALLLGSLLGLSLLALHGLVDATVWGTRMSIAPWLLVAPVLAQIAGASKKESIG